MDFISRDKKFSRTNIIKRNCRQILNNINKFLIDTLIYCILCENDYYEPNNYNELDKTDRVDNIISISKNINEIPDTNLQEETNKKNINQVITEIQASTLEENNDKISQENNDTILQEEPNKQNIN